MAFQGVGEVTCSLGEVTQPRRLIIFWGGNPAESHPRHFTKYSLMPKGMFVPNGRKDRTACSSTSARPRAPRRPTSSCRSSRGGLRRLWTLRALAKGIDLDPVSRGRRPASRWTRWQDLMDRMKNAKFGVILFGMGLTMTRGKHLNSEAVLALARDMNATRASSPSRSAATATSPGPTTSSPGEPAIRSA